MPTTGQQPSDLPWTRKHGTLNLGGIVFTFELLANGSLVVPESCLAEAFGGNESVAQTPGSWLPPFLTTSPLADLLGETGRAATNPVFYRNASGLQRGYDLRLLQLLCEAQMSLPRANVAFDLTRHLCVHGDILNLAGAVVGEAPAGLWRRYREVTITTGADEIRPFAAALPDTFWQEIARFNGESELINETVDTVLTRRLPATTFAAMSTAKNPPPQLLDQVAQTTETMRASRARRRRSVYDSGSRARRRSARHA